ncbi:hypothetical protein DENSPDRAFT_846286 [Dentipellis sp. KUC8613]|nr:hypothetical protein DENSPDRAFT_846286 [Dentipellis sp. KUC8613]
MLTPRVLSRDSPPSRVHRGPVALLAAVIAALSRPTASLARHVGPYATLTPHRPFMRPRPRLLPQASVDRALAPRVRALFALYVPSWPRTHRPRHVRAVRAAPDPFTPSSRSSRHPRALRRLLTPSGASARRPPSPHALRRL